MQTIDNFNYQDNVPEPPSESTIYIVKESFENLRPRKNINNICIDE